MLSLPFFLGAACVPNKKIIYMQNMSDESAVAESTPLVAYREDSDEYQLQFNDVIDVTMKTSSDELNAMLRVDESNNQMRNMDGLNSGDAFFLTGYTVDNEGIVSLPLVGDIKVVGMTVGQVKTAIAERLQKYVLEDNYFVRVRLGGIRYSALGEFQRPGKFTVLQNRLTIYEAIANAGDMTTAANRMKVRVVRQYPDGIKTHTINMLSDDIMKSEFFFVRPNDMIYAEPMRVKQLGTGMTLAQSLQLALSVVTVGLLFINVTN